MTLPGTITAATPAAPPERAVWRAEIIETVKLAWPIALTQLGQIAMMTTDLALIGRLGDGAIAAVGLAHLILFVGFVLGRRDPVATRRAGFGAIALGAALMVAMTVIVVAFRDAIPQLFLGDDGGGNAAAARLAATLLLIGASFFVTDGVQAIAAGALRGLNDTRV